MQRSARSRLFTIDGIPNCACHQAPMPTLLLRGWEPDGCLNRNESGCENIRLISNVTNPLSRNQHWRADSDGWIGLCGQPVEQESTLAGG